MMLDDKTDLTGVERHLAVMVERGKSNWIGAIRVILTVGELYELNAKGSRAVSFTKIRQ